MQLQNKVILVTGAASGIGRQTSLTLGAAGAKVFATDLNHDGAEKTAAMIRAAGGIATGLLHDVTEEGAWRRVIQCIEETEGRLDGLVNSAGLMVVRPFLETDFSLYRRQQAINVDSVWLGSQASYSLLSKTASEYGSASIVNLCSILGQKGGGMHAAYCTSKGAVRLMSKALAIEFGKARIRVNSVHPGLVETPLGMGAMQDMISHGVPLASAGAAADIVAQKTPLGRWAQPTDVANLISFLCAEESQFISGTELTVDGGYSAS